MAQRTEATALWLLELELGTKVGAASACITAPIAALLAQPELLRWTQSISKSSATIYDRALDANYFATELGGASHRLFDGGHDLLYAWQAVRAASDEDTLAQEVIGYVTAS